MRRLSRPELIFYASALSLSVLYIIRECITFSARADVAILEAAGSSYLPYPLSSILQLTPSYVARLQPDLQDKAGILVPALSNARPRAAHVPGLVGDYLALPKDVSDVQWREFNASLGLLAAGLAAYVAVSWLARLLSQSVWLGACLTASLVFLGVLHGTHALWPLILACLTYTLSRFLAGRPYGLPIMWATQLGLFVYIRAHEGLYFSSISTSLAWLDRHRGMLRWHIYHNFALLRAMSYFTDLHWARQQASGSDTGDTVTKDNPRQRPQGKASVAPPHLFTSLPLFLVYTLYPPLYIAGPVITYSAWATQATNKTHVTRKQVTFYALRWLFAYLLLDAYTRTLHFNAIAKYGLLTRGVLQYHGLSVAPVDYAYTAIVVLLFMWLKFLVIWRFFRLVSLTDGFDPPENMRRCVLNNYDIQGFWQGWHCSFNRWLVRYVYVPLGGQAWRWLNIWPVFLFVAVWHDLDWRLLSWGLLMPAAFLPELAVKALGRSPWLSPHTDTWWYRQVAVLLGSVNVLALITGNLVGFVVGVDGVVPLLKEALGEPWTAVGVFAVISCAVQVMFELRLMERPTEKQTHTQ